MTATIIVPAPRAIFADDDTLEALGARNVHLGRIDPWTGEVLVCFDCDSDQQRVHIGQYLLGN